MNATTLPAAQKDLGIRPSVPAVQPAAENPPRRIEFANDPQSAPGGARRPKNLKRAALAAAALLAGAAVCLAGYHWWTIGRFMETTDDAYVGGDVTVIAPKVSGFIAKLAVGDNQEVHAGDLLLKLDDRDYCAALARAEATVALQQAALTNLDATRRWQEAVVAQARAGVAATDAETTRAQDDQVRYRNLLASGAVSTQNFQQADASYKQAVAAGDKSGAALEAAQRQLDVIATQKEQAQAALEVAIAERDLARLNVSYTELRSPIDGTVGNRSAQTGAYATTGSQLIALVPARGLWVDANFKESQLGRIRAGAPATVEVDSLPGKIFPGRVASIAPATGAQFSVLPPENATGNFTKIVQRVAVRIVLDNEAAAGQLRPGLSVTAHVNGKPNS